MLPAEKYISLHEDLTFLINCETIVSLLCPFVEAWYQLSFFIVLNSPSRWWCLGVSATWLQLKNFRYRQGSTTFPSGSKSWCTLPLDWCTCKFKLHVFCELHAVSPAFFFYTTSSCLQGNKHTGFYMVIKSHIRQTRQKPFYVAWEFFMILFFSCLCHTPYLPCCFLLSFSGLETSYSKYSGDF